MRWRGCPETSVKDCSSAMREVTEERSGSLKSRII